jgi:hypothetical protein
MWNKAADLRLYVLMGLRNGLLLIRRRSLTENAVVDHLESANWK